MRIGLDVGSTTLKCVAIDENNEIVYKAYERHFSKITAKAGKMLSDICSRIPDSTQAVLVVSGSAGMGFANELGLSFAQEVYATRIAVKRLLPETDVVIELGGEDAKILFLHNGMEVRMNGSCAGGTGAFIDQMASLLEISLEEMNSIAAQSETVYTIASRCGVFAKSDIQPLLNQGAKKSDISTSIFAAVVNQTISGLAQGRDISGRVVYLGGPLSFLSQLRKSFDDILNIQGLCPENSLYYVALGAALIGSEKDIDLVSIIDKIESFEAKGGYSSCDALFNNAHEYEEFSARHKKNTVKLIDNENYEGQVFLGIDSGSTTVKAVIVNDNEEILSSEYLPNSGNPIPIIKEYLTGFYHKHPKAVIASSAVTGYGEEIVKKAFNADYSIVETIAHFTAAKKFKPEVDFIIDIGGQDIKCFKIKNMAIDNIFLNEACSSGCGSFLQTFASAWGYSIADFSTLGLFADKPVDLGSRCTVFMNSSVKQSQKDGASIENISAGLSISIVKNALYKVIRATTAEDLGKNIVVQGGTFLNDAVLRAFEKEVGIEVVRPDIAGLMGAYGAALYAKNHSSGKSTVLGLEGLNHFTHSVKTAVCGGCSNHCKLTINTFNNAGKYIGGNRCSFPVSQQAESGQYNLYDYKRSLLSDYKPKPGSRGKIGLPMGLNLYELYPFWHTFFTALCFEVVVSPKSTRELYLSGQHTIPSDTICYPAKIMHGHIEALIDSGVKTIFYPCFTYYFDEGQGDNHYNCPVVAYYPEVIRSNVPCVESIKYICTNLGLHRKEDFKKKMFEVLSENFEDIALGQVETAVEAAYAEYYAYMKKIRDKGEELLRFAAENNRQVIALVGRPYHLDEEINHGIDKLICENGTVLVTEDSISHLSKTFPTKVLNQWTFHARLYSAAKYIADSKDNKINLVQLVSFGCGVDAITTDECRDILESSGKIYTQIKIDEITNLGAVKIRLRSLFAALEQ
jgi:predicted CoA-substrate-specific enzyme activase